MRIIRMQSILYSQTVKTEFTATSLVVSCVFIVFWLVVESSSYHIHNVLTMICREISRVALLDFWTLHSQRSCKQGLNVVISVFGQPLWWNGVRRRPVYIPLPSCHSIIDQTVFASSSVSDASPVIQPARCDTLRI